MMNPDCVALRHHRFSGVIRGVSADILRFMNKSPENQAVGEHLHERMSAFLAPDILSVFWYRVAHFLFVNRWHRLAVVVARLNFYCHKCSIPPQSCIGPGFRLSHPVGVTFFGRAGCDLTMFAHAVCCSKETGFDGPVELGPKLGDGVTIGANTVVMGPVIIGDRAGIAYGIAVKRDTPSWSLALPSKPVNIRRA